MLNALLNEFCDRAKRKYIKNPDHKTYTGEQGLGGLAHISPA